MGHHGRLPELGDDDADTVIASSIVDTATIRRRSLIPSPTPFKFQGAESMEPIIEVQIQQSSFSLDPDSLPRKSSLSTLPRKKSSKQEEGSVFTFDVIDDQVVSEDGTSVRRLYSVPILNIVRRWKGTNFAFSR